MVDRDSRAEARKAWGQIKGAFIRDSYNRRPRASSILGILEALARREYEAGYAAGHEDQMRMRIMDAMERKSVRRG